jgi:uncharacterized protein
MFHAGADEAQPRKPWIGREFPLCAIRGFLPLVVSAGVRSPHYTARLPLHDMFILLALGLAAGALGGMLGIGGSIIMIPILTIILHRNVHVAQAAAMIINVAVSLPAMMQHHRAGAVRWNVVGRMLIPATVFILIGVEAGNMIDAQRMQQIFGVFLIYVALENLWRIVRKRAEPVPHEQRITWTRCGFVGAAMGFWAGLLGVGGGIVAVPLLQKLCRLPLRQCIATTAACMCFSASFGAIRKNMALPSLGLDPQESLQIAAFLAPTAVLGGLFGGRLAHALPLNAVRVAFVLLLLWSSAELLGIVRVV